MAQVYISIGSNLGDKKANCDRALRRIVEKNVAEVITVSPYYRTEPVNYTDQDWFVNAAACIETDLAPVELLTALKETEQELGTVEKTVRFGPRKIDLDILLYDDLIIKTERLCIPHERMHERVFVLKPLCDINAEILHPVLKRRIDELLEETDDTNQGIIPLDG